MEARAGPLTQPLDDESGDQAPALVTKKKTLSASERDTWVRAAFQVQMTDLNAHDLVVVDEFGCNTDWRVAGRAWLSLMVSAPYSPDFAPIELAFAKIKTILRSIGARTVEALEQAIAVALSQISAADAAAFFRHCGYWVPSPMAQAFCT